MKKQKKITEGEKKGLQKPASEKPRPSSPPPPRKKPKNN